HRLLTHEVLDRPQETAVIDAARRGQRPDQNAGEREGREDEPHGPVDGSKDALGGRTVELHGGRRLGLCRGRGRGRGGLLVWSPLLLAGLFVLYDFGLHDASPIWMR